MMLFPILPGSTPIGVDVANAAGEQGVLAGTQLMTPVPLPIFVGGFRSHNIAVANAQRTARRLARDTRRAAVVSKPGAGGKKAKVSVSMTTTPRRKNAEPKGALSMVGRAAFLFSPFFFHITDEKTSACSTFSHPAPTP
jgi:hypothetical protein